MKGLSDNTYGGVVAGLVIVPTSGALGSIESNMRIRLPDEGMRLLSSGMTGCLSASP